LPVPKFIGNYTKVDMEEEEEGENPSATKPDLQFKDWGSLLE